MKRLTAIRHGKSSWELSCQDRERPLLQRGIDDAHLIGRYLHSMGFMPDLLWSSPAVRALSSAVMIADEIGYSTADLKIKPELYTFNMSQQLEVVRSCADHIEHLCYFAHNNGLTDLVNQIGSEHFENVPTTGVVMIEFDVNKWSEIQTGETTFHVFAKELE